MVSLYAVSLVLFLLADYDFVWTQPEEFNWREYILADGTQLTKRDLLKPFDWQTFEQTARTTRPLSALVEIIDTKCRAWLWQFVVPHPSLSITWILLLLVNPYLFFRLLRGVGVEKNLSVLMTSVYVTNPGTLSLLAVNFRPSKPVANTAILLCLTLASSWHRRSQCAKGLNGGGGRGIILFGSLYFVMLISFFFDETGFLAFMAVPLLFPRLFLHRLGRILLYGSLPLVAFACYSKLFPFLAQWAGYSGESIERYSAIATITRHPAITDLTQWSAGTHHSLADMAAPISRFMLQVWKHVGGDLLTNVTFFFSDTFGLVDPRLTGSSLYHVLWTGTVLLILWVAISMTANLRRGRAGGGLALRVRPYTIEKASALLLVFSTLCANILLHIVVNYVWGLHWLSTFWPIFFFLFAAVWLNRVKLRLALVALLSIFVMSTSFYNFVYVNNAFKRFFYYEAVDMRDVWTNKVNRFTVPFGDGAMNYQFTRLIWEEHENRISIQGIPAELYYLVHDLRLVPPGTTYPQVYGTSPVGHIPTFTLTRSEGVAQKYFVPVPED